jgi:quercetin dioxygenase-like cupin family protein
MSVADWRTEPYWQKRPGVHLKTITGAASQLCMIKLDPGMQTDHRHPEEQMGFVLRGCVELTIDGVRHVLEPGDAYLVPGNIRHGFKVVGAEPVEYLEVFTPPKAENAPPRAPDAGLR